MGIIHKKRIILKAKIYISEKSSSFYPKKRVTPDYNIYTENIEFINLTTEIQQLSKEFWPKSRLEKSTAKFWKELKNNENKINKFERKIRIQNLINKISRLFKKLGRFK